MDKMDFPNDLFSFGAIDDAFIPSLETLEMNQLDLEIPNDLLFSYGVSFDEAVPSLETPNAAVDVDVNLEDVLLANDFFSSLSDEPISSMDVGNVSFAINENDTLITNVDPDGTNELEYYYSCWGQDDQELLSDSPVQTPETYQEETQPTEHAASPESENIVINEKPKQEKKQRNGKKRRRPMYKKNEQNPRYSEEEKKVIKKAKRSRTYRVNKKIEEKRMFEENEMLEREIKRTEDRIKALEIQLLEEGIVYFEESAE